MILSFSPAALHQEEMTVSRKLQDAPLDKESFDNWLRKAYLGFVSAREGFFSDHDCDPLTTLHCLQKTIKHNGKICTVDELPQLTKGKLEVTLNMISINKAIYDTLISVFNRLNIWVARITASPYSDFWALQTSMVLDKNLLLIDFASRFITASHFDNCHLQKLHRLKVGNDDLTRQLMSMFQIDDASAESLKCDYGLIFHQEKIQQSLKERNPAWARTKKQEILDNNHDWAQKHRAMVNLLPWVLTPLFEGIACHIAKTFSDISDDALIVLKGGGAQISGLSPLFQRVFRRRVLTQTLAEIDGLSLENQSYSNLTALGLLKTAQCPIMDYAELPKNNLKSKSWLDKIKKVSIESA